MRLALGLAAHPLDESEPLPPHEDRAIDAGLSLEALYRRERARLIGFVARKGSRDDAEDVVQQVFARLAAKGNAAELDRPEPYLRQAAHNLIVDRTRVDMRESAGRHVSIEDVELTDHDPVAALEARDRLARLENAVARLKPLTREIFVACRVHGYSHAEIAQRTGLSVKGVEKQMGKAIKALSRHLDAQG